MEGEPSQPPNSSWPPSQNGSHTKATPTVNLTFSSYYQHSSPVAALFIVAYVLIFLLCMVGNALVCFIVLKNRHMRTVTNMFILNLAVSDLLVGIFCMPTTLVDNLITGWPFDNATCKMSGLVQGMSVSASVFTLVAIAVESAQDCFPRCLQFLPPSWFCLCSLALQPMELRTPSQVPLHRAPFPREADAAQGAGHHRGHLGAGPAHHVPLGRHADRHAPGAPLHGGRPQPLLPALLVLGGLAREGHAQGLHHRALLAHLPGAAGAHRAHMQSASQGSGWSIMGRRIEVPTKVFCLTVNQNTRGARIPSSCQSGKRDCVYSCDVQTELFCAQISITHALSRPSRPIVTPHWSCYRFNVLTGILCPDTWTLSGVLSSYPEAHRGNNASPDVPSFIYGPVGSPKVTTLPQAESLKTNWMCDG
ncbi:neuropeptide FF receptor 1 isoform X4 [Canis lupus familiaris]|uniref:neuropeptide FF receptor 1 isoform X4 n=1 Tax=Canis lupus familiaris TaxID=9615 RepID=UPI0018F58597|nr:neuropeptide FF receptor 1 isoform X4 [Canis lupus familiaris]